MKKGNNSGVGISQGVLEPANIVKEVIFTILTCGLWDIVWQYKQIRMVNTLLGERRFNFVSWLLLTLVTCGVYHLYHEYLMGRAIVELQRKYGLDPSEGLPALSIILALLSFGIITDAIQQKELNLIVEKLRHGKTAG